MAPYRSVPTGENGSHEETKPREPAATYRVHASVHRVEPPKLQTVRDPAPLEADSHQLGPAHDTMLAVRKLGNSGIRMLRGTLCSYVMYKVPAG